MWMLRPAKAILFLAQGNKCRSAFSILSLRISRNEFSEANNRMSWQDDAIDTLKCVWPCSYSAGAPPAAEPTALAAIALCGAGLSNAARPHLRWLAENQNGISGSVAPVVALQWPGWPTPLAILAATAFPNHAEGSGLRIDQAKQWLLSATGMTLDKTTEVGHNVALVGWPWVTGTHSWQEPTAWSVLALKALGLREHPRTREGVRLLIDRLLPEGGCNYGNTYVLGQKLRPQIQPSGLALLALAGEQSDDIRISRTINYVASALSEQTTPISLSYGLLGLTAHHRSPPEAAAWLESAHTRTVKRDPSAVPIALLVLAEQGNDCPLMKVGSSTSVN
jgi:hypothetical protein